MNAYATWENDAISQNLNKPAITISLCQKISAVYRSSIQAFVEFLWKHELFVTGMVLGTLLQEPWQAIKAAFLNLSNWKEHFNFYDLNPKVLTKEQAQKQPILLIHGNYHNQSAWLNLAKKLQQVKELGPVYTINLPNGDITDKDFKILWEKFIEIEEQFKQFNSEYILDIDVVGHSRGGALVQLMTEYMVIDGYTYRWKEKPPFLRKVIKIGSVASQKQTDDLRQRVPHFIDQMYEVTGKYDCLETRQSLYNTDHKQEVPAGHLGLLNSPEAHQYIIQCLVNNRK